MEKEQLEQLKNESAGENARPPAENKKSAYLGKYRKYLSKKNIIWAVIGVLIIAGGAYFRPKIFKPAPKSIHQVAIVVRGQQNPNPAEDARSSLKAGDVLAVQSEDHKWSNTEKISYLILKMNLTDEQAAKLTQAKERELKFKDLSKEERKRIEEEKKRAKDEGRKYEEEPRRETLIAREYYIDLIKYFPDFKAIDLMKGQPYQDKVYDWGIVDKK